MDTYLAVVQTLAVVVAAGGLIIALVIAGKDRRSAEKTAEADRKSATKAAKEDRLLTRLEAERRHRLDLLIRLSANLERGGSHDLTERQRLGAEERALITALGPEVIPELFAEQGSYDEGQQNLKTKPASEWGWSDRADRVRIALRNIAESYPE